MDGWRQYRADFFHYYFPPDLATEDQIKALNSQLDHLREELIEVLDLKGLDDICIEVYLRSSNVLEKEHTPQTKFCQIQVAYQPDSDHEALEKALISLLLVKAIDHRNSDLTLFVEALRGYILQRQGKRDAVLTDTALSLWLSGREPVALTDLWRKPLYRDGLLHTQMATSFLTFLRKTYPAIPLKHFIQQAAGGGFAQAAEVVYRKPARRLEEEWLKTLHIMPARTLGLLDVIRYAASSWRRHWKIAIIIIVALLSNEAFNTFFAFSLKAIVDSVQNPALDRPLTLILIALACGFCLSTICGIYGQKLTARVSAAILHDIRIQMFRHMQHLSIDFYVRRQPGDILARFSNDLAVIEQGVALRFMDGMIVSLTLVVNIPLLFYLDTRLAIVTMAVLPMIMLVLKRFGPPASASSYQLKGAEGEMLNKVQESMRAQQIVRSFNLQEIMFDRFGKQLTEVFEKSIRAIFMKALINVSAAAGVLLLELIVTGIGSLLAFYGHLSAGTLIGFLNLLWVVDKGIRDMTMKVIPDMIGASGPLQRVKELLAEMPNVADEADASELLRFSDEIRFENVTFSYTGHKVDLHKVCMRIKEGQYIGVVGPSGSGKSTNVNLLMRFYDPTMGRITVDGCDLRKVTQESIRRQIGTVFQDTFLFNVSIRENIHMAKMDATDQEIEHAAKLAEIHNYIMSLSDGYETVVGEGGGRLSGGQKQRIAIARAILCDSPIWIFDEATSALDPGTEAALQATFERLARGRTVIAVTHRLMSVQNADCIFVFNDGQLIEYGRHEELIAKDGLYYQLWQKQTGFEIGQDGRYVRITAEKLNQLPLFTKLDLDTLSAIAKNFFSESYGEGATVLQQRDPGDRFYIIARGEVEVSTRDHHGAERKLAILRDGDYFGEMALLRNEPRSATVKTLTPCLFVCLHRDLLFNLIDEFPAIKDKLHDVVQERMKAIQVDPMVETQN